MRRKGIKFRSLLFMPVLLSLAFCPPMLAEGTSVGAAKKDGLVEAHKDAQTLENKKWPRTGFLALLALLSLPEGTCADLLRESRLLSFRRGVEYLENVLSDYFVFLNQGDIAARKELETIKLASSRLLAALLSNERSSSVILANIGLPGVYQDWREFRGSGESSDKGYQPKSVGYFLKKRLFPSDDQHAEKIFKYLGDAGIVMVPKGFRNLSKGTSENLIKRFVLKHTVELLEKGRFLPGEDEVIRKFVETILGSSNLVVLNKANAAACADVPTTSTLTDLVGETVTDFFKKVKGAINSYCPNSIIDQEEIKRIEDSFKEFLDEEGLLLLSKDKADECNLLSDKGEGIKEKIRECGIVKFALSDKERRDKVNHVLHRFINEQANTDLLFLGLIPAMVTIAYHSLRAKIYGVSAGYLYPKFRDAFGKYLSRGVFPVILLANLDKAVDYVTETPVSNHLVSFSCFGMVLKSTGHLSQAFAVAAMTDVLLNNIMPESLVSLNQGLVQAHEDMKRIYKTCGSIRESLENLFNLEEPKEVSKSSKNSLYAGLIFLMTILVGAVISVLIGNTLLIGTLLGTVLGAIVAALYLYLVGYFAS